MSRSSQLVLVPDPRPEEPRPLSCHASPERARPAEVGRVARMLEAGAGFGLLANSLEELLVVLNPERQIVLANQRLAELLSREPLSLVGLRLGEALDCIHAADMSAGCGTSEACLACGACQAIVGSRESRSEERRECRLLRRTPEGVAAMDFRVRATPLPMQGEELTILALSDATDQNRRRVLERLFFHDVLNTAGAVQGLLKLLPLLDDPGEQVEVRRRAEAAADQLVEEVLAQRDLAAAERGDLAVRPERLDVASLMARICLLYAGHAQAFGKRIASPQVPPHERLVADEVLLRRVLSNLLKNALEASSPGGVVGFTYRRHGEKALFSVHNDGQMPEVVRLQVFQRSFSTKEGTGRGLGTYSVKLLTERYLGGRVSFQSAAGKGTTFTVELPT